MFLEDFGGHEKDQLHLEAEVLIAAELLKEITPLGVGHFVMVAHEWLYIPKKVRESRDVV